jgi:integrase
MRSKVRGNGQGCAYQRGRYWEAQVVVGWKQPSDPEHKPVPDKRRKCGFRTKKEALAYCEEMRKQHKVMGQITMKNLFLKWEESYKHRVKPKTMEGYEQAFDHFSKLHPVYIDLINATDLQKCLDECKNGKRTHEMMKTTANLLWKYAIDSGYITQNVAYNLYTGKGKSVQRKPITEDELKLIRKVIGSEPYADYVYCLCYLGFRPTEFLSLRKTDCYTEGKIRYLVGGSKTEAGTDRTVVIPKQIEAIIDERMTVIGTDLIFPMICHNRKGEFTGYKQMTHNYFNNYVFKPLMAHLGVSDRVPYSARHTYADKLKKASGDAKDKAALIGHSDYDFTQHAYQSAPLKDLKKVVDSIK